MHPAASEEALSGRPLRPRRRAAVVGGVFGRRYQASNRKEVRRRLTG